jgi:hypothetical protein
MRRTRRRLPPIQFVLRFYPGQDDDLIQWLDKLDEEHFGAKTQALKAALRRGMSADPVPAMAVASTLDLSEVRQVVEAAVASVLGRFEGRIAGVATALPLEEDDEVEDLLDALEGTLVLGD